jgi:hypothetical protein
MNQNKIIEHRKGCSHYIDCSVNICPLDNNAKLLKNLPGEKRCPYSIDRKNKVEKGTKTLMPTPLFNLIPIRNLKLLNRRNKKRFATIHK